MPLCMEAGIYEDPSGYENELVCLEKVLVESIPIVKNVGDL